jgi:hypothetical protein
MTQGYCADKAELVGFLYDDCEPGERDRIAAHVADCPDCTAELASLSATRGQLGAWVPPTFANATAGKPWALGFQIDPARMTGPLEATGPGSAAHTEGAATVDGTARAPFSVIEAGRPDTARDVRAASPWWKQPLPAWAQAAAAVLIFAAGVGFGSGNAGRSGSAVAPTSGQQVAARGDSPQQGVRPTPVVAITAPAVAPEELARLDQKLQAMQAEIAALRAASSGTGAGRTAPGGAEPTPTLAQVQDLVAASELRVQDQMLWLDRAVQGYVQQVGNLLPPAERARAQFSAVEPAAFSRPAFGLQRVSNTR